MALDLTAEQKELGKGNANAAAYDLTRRNFMKSLAISGTSFGAVGAAAYFGYQAFNGRPVKAALIGCGDEGGILMGDHDSKYLEFVALCDIRPYNKKRIIEGEPAPSPRKGYKAMYSERDAKKMAAFLNTPIVTVRVDPQGKLVEVKDAKGGAARLQAELPFRLTLPNAAPAAGQAWDRPFAVK